MTANKNTVLIGEKVILVPYQCNHIPVHKLESTDCHHDWKSGYLLQKCHTWISWMLNKEPRQLTVSELLTLEEEYDLQCMCVLYYNLQANECKMATGQRQVDIYHTSCIHLSHDVHSLNLTLNPDPINPTHLVPSDPCITSLPMIGDVNSTHGRRHHGFNYQSLKHAGWPQHTTGCPSSTYPPSTKLTTVNIHNLAHTVSHQSPFIGVLDVDISVAALQLLRETGCCRGDSL